MQPQTTNSLSIHSSKSSNSLPVKIDDYILTKVIGKGQYGIVYQAYDYKSKANFALKQIDKALVHQDEKIFSLFNDEINITRSIRHKNVIHLYKVFETSDDYFLVYDFCERGGLFIVGIYYLYFWDCHFETQRLQILL